MYNKIKYCKAFKVKILLRGLFSFLWLIKIKTNKILSTLYCIIPCFEYLCNVKMIKR